MLAGGLLQALEAQGLVRVLVDAPGQACFALALFGGSPALGFLGLGLMFLADEIGTPLVASWGLHRAGALEPAVLLPEPPQLQSPPQARAGTWLFPLAIRFDAPPRAGRHAPRRQPEPGRAAPRPSTPR